MEFFFSYLPMCIVIIIIIISIIIIIYLFTLSGNRPK